jgi:hypothetical protein
VKPRDVEGQASSGSDWSAFRGRAFAGISLSSVPGGRAWDRPRDVGLLRRFSRLFIWLDSWSWVVAHEVEPFLRFVYPASSFQSPKSDRCARVHLSESGGQAQVVLVPCAWCLVALGVRSRTAGCLDAWGVIRSRRPGFPRGAAYRLSTSSTQAETNSSRPHRVAERVLDRWKVVSCQRVVRGGGSADWAVPPCS